MPNDYKDIKPCKLFSFPLFSVFSRTSGAIATFLQVGRLSANIFILIISMITTLNGKIYIQQQTHTKASSGTLYVSQKIQSRAPIDSIRAGKN